MNTPCHPITVGLRSRALRLFAGLALASVATLASRADVVFSRSSSTAESWAPYSATFTPTYSGNYSFAFNLTAGGPSGDNAILIDAVKITQGATTVFADGFETPDLATNTGSSANGGSATIGNWSCKNYSGILDGSPANWGLAAQGLGSADGTSQYAYLQAVFGTLGKIQATNTVALVAGQTYTISFYQASRRDFGGTTSYTVTLDYVPPTVFASGLSPVIAYDPIYPATAYPNWTTPSQPIPLVGYNAAWVNPHPASVFPIGSHPWEFIAPYDFTANWINAWSNLSSRGPAGQSWTKYTTTVTGEGDFVLQFLADNASWIYIDGQLIGYQDWDWPHNGTGRYTIRLTGSGPHELCFIIWDGGGAAGGKFRLETTQSFRDNNPGDPLPPPAADTTAPVIVAPGNLTKEATGPAGAIATFTATATDDKDGSVPVTAVPPSGSMFPLGTTVVGLAAADAAGNTASASFTVTVQDTTPPVITAPANLTAEATSAAGAAVSYSASAYDLVDNSTAVAGAPGSGSTFPLGTTPVALTSSDSHGNTAAKSFQVTVRDTTAPALNVPASQTLEATSAAGATAEFAASASDAVGVTALTYSAASGSTFPLGTTPVTVTARDAAGNAAAGSFAITVQDTTAPALTVPANQVLEATSAAGATATFAASATDAVGVTALTYSAASGSTFPLGTTTVVVTAKDAAGNATTGAFTVTVRDTTAPAIASLTPSLATLWPPNHKMVALTLSAPTTDAVGVTSLRIVNVTSSEPDNGLGDGDTAGDIQVTGNLSLQLRAERSGNGNGRTYTLTVEARDAAGNTSTRSVTVSVPKSMGK